MLHMTIFFLFSLLNKDFGVFEYACEGDLVMKSTNEMIPKFVSSVFLENKQEIGKIDEIFGSVTDIVRLLLNIDSISQSSRHQMLKRLPLQQEINFTLAPIVSYL